MSYSDFARGLSAKQVAREKELREEQEMRRQIAEEEEFVSILRPIPAEEMTAHEMFERRRSGALK